MGDFLSKIKSEAGEQAEKVGDGAAKKLGDEAKDKVVEKIDDLIHTSTHKVNDKTSTELKDGAWCVDKEGGGGVAFTKVQACEAHKSLKDVDPMILQCSDDKELKINRQCSTCQQHIMINN